MQQVAPTHVPTPYFLNPETYASLMAESAARRKALADRREARERAKLDKRHAISDRRECPPPPGMDRRRFATMADKLAAEAATQDARRQTGAPPSGLGELLSPEVEARLARGLAAHLSDLS